MTNILGLVMFVCGFFSGLCTMYYISGGPKEILIPAIIVGGLGLSVYIQCSIYEPNN